VTRDLLPLLCCPECQGDLTLLTESAAPEVVDGTLRCDACVTVYPVTRGVPRFVSSDGPVSSFSYEWNRWKQVQFDIANNSRESEDTFIEKTGFMPEDLAGKLVLDVGCGAGRFLDVASRWNARVIGIDLSFAVDAAYQNLAHRPNVQIIQADVFRLPFRANTFDAVFSLGVLHHSRDTEQAFKQLPPLLKPGGDLAVWLYYYPDAVFRAASDFWRAVLRPLPAWAVSAWSWLLVTLLSWLWRTPILSREPWSHLRRILPMSMHHERQWRILDTFDWYSPRYQDKECSPARVIGWCKAAGIRDVRVLPFPTSIRGRRDPAAVLPAVNYGIPEVSGRRVLVFGASGGGAAAIRLLRRVAPGAVVGVVDNDPGKEGMPFEGLRVRRFEQIARESYDLVVIASLPGRQPISAQLRTAGLIQNEDFIALDQLQEWYRASGEYEPVAA
jgi:SAM-dependent methyltransferase/uncharacterized protein YbaR (Trm112 family)